MLPRTREPKKLADTALAAPPPEQLPTDIAWMAQAGSQALFLACPIYEVLFHGTRGPGKTDALLMDFVKDVGKGFGDSWTGILFRRTYKELGDVIERSKKWFKLVCPGATYNKTAHEWTFPGGERLLFRYIEKVGEDGDYAKYHGHQYPWQGWEELCTWATSELYLRMQSCCRSTDPKVAPIARIRATANPLGVGHHWVKKRFQLGGTNHTRIITEKSPISGNDMTRCAIFGSLQENKILLRSDPQYVDKLYASCRGSKVHIKAWIYGSWDVTAGGMFDDIWDPDVHVVNDFTVPASWTICRAFDWGSSHPFSVGWWAKSDGSDYRDATGTWHATVRGDLFRIGEWYGSTGEPNEGLRLLSPDIARGIIEREMAMGIFGRVEAGPADPSIFTETDGKSIAGTMGKFLRVGDKQVMGPRFKAADNSRIPGWDRVRAMLGNAKPGPEGAREHAGLFVCVSCRWFLELFPVTQRDPKDLEDVDTESEDHLQDETRYMCKSASEGVVSGSVRAPTGAEQAPEPFKPGPKAKRKKPTRVVWR